MRDFICLFLDPEFENFNYSALADPALRPGYGPGTKELYKLMYLARRGDRSAELEFADTMYWTLQEGSLEGFKWKYGPRPITYADWYYAKLMQFVETLLYEQLMVDQMRHPVTDRPWEEGHSLTGRGPIVQFSELEEAFTPEDSQQFDWYSFVSDVVRAGDQRLTVFRNLLQQRAGSQKAAEPTERKTPDTGRDGKRSRWSRHDERTLMIVSCRERGMEPYAICKVLDQKGFPTTRQMQELGVCLWTDAWDDRDFRRNVQQVFAKAVRRGRSFKS